MRPHHVNVCLFGLGAVLAGLLFAGSAIAAEPALWLRNPSISPDGSSIAFS